MNSEPFLNWDYYNKLSPEGRKRFESRSKQLSGYLQFKGMEELQITDTMRLQIAASLVQLTYGFRQYHLPAFRLVLVYPRRFYHQGWKQWMKGFAAGNGTIALSWEDFCKGYSGHDDNYNLGLHELAHALHLNLKKGFDSDPVFSHFFLHWEDLSMHEFERINGNSAHFLRQYGGSNMHEFFAVCVEHFFESPQAFRLALPDLYERTAWLLNQDPLNSAEDYKLQISPDRKLLLRKLPNLQKAAQRERSLSWWHYASACGMFIALPVIFINLYETIIPHRSLWLISALLILLGVLQFPWFVRKGWYDYSVFFALYVIFGFALNTLALLALFNNQFSTEKHSEIHPVVRVIPLDARYDLIRISDPRFKPFERLLEIPTTPQPPVAVRLHFERGIFGFDNLRGLTPVFGPSPPIAPN